MTCGPGWMGGGWLLRVHLVGAHLAGDGDDGLGPVTGGEHHLQAEPPQPGHAATFFVGADGTIEGRYVGETNRQVLESHIEAIGG